MSEINDHKETNGDFYENDEEIINWEKEAKAIIRDVKDHVKEIFLSRTLPSSELEIFINIKTLEDSRFCVRATGSGFQIAGNDFDKTDLVTEDPEEFFETPYSLLTSISSGYVNSFAASLSRRLDLLK